jgi:hypothetical protein
VEAIMRRASNLLPAFVLILTLAGCASANEPGADMAAATNSAADSGYGSAASSNAPAAAETRHQTPAHNPSCSDQPMYLNPAYCQPRD